MTRSVPQCVQPYQIPFYDATHSVSIPGGRGEELSQAAAANYM